MSRKTLQILQAGFFFLLSSPVLSQNSALKLNGSSTFAAMPHDVVPGSEDFTIEFWAYVPALATDGPHQFVSQGTADPLSGMGFGFYIGYDGSNGGHIMAGDQWPDIGVTMPVGQWVHMAMTLNAESYESNFYMNGVLVASTLTFIAGGGSPFQVGIQTDTTEFMNGRIDELRIWKEVRTPEEIKAGMYGTVDPATANLFAYYKMNDGAGSNTISNSSSTSGLDGTISDATAWAPSPIQFSDNALAFDGIDDQVLIPPSANYDLANGSVEFWVSPFSLSATPGTVVANQGAGGTRYAFQVSATQVGIDNGGGFNGISYSLPLGTWTHLAFVNDGVQTTVYVNGIAQSAKIPGGFGTATLQPLAIGISKTSGADTNPFMGGVDEVRVWNEQRSPANILNFMNNSMSGSESNLEGLFSFDQGIPDADNTGLITAIDNTPNNNHGTLTNFNMSTVGSNFTSHNMSSPLPVTLAGFNATRQGTQVLLQWRTAFEQNTREFTIERSFDGNQFLPIGSVAAAGNSHSPTNYSFADDGPGQNKNFYRLKQSDLDGRFTYSGVRLITFTPAAGRLIWYANGERSAAIRLQQGNSEAYTLLDLGGHKIRQGRLSAGMTTISDLPGGIYLIQVYTAGGHISESRIVIP
jgi:hypothetical protein